MTPQEIGVLEDNSNCGWTISSGPHLHSQILAQKIREDLETRGLVLFQDGKLSFIELKFIGTCLKVNLKEQKIYI